MLTLLVGLSLGQVLGTGRDGALTVGNRDTVVNAHSPVTAFTSGTNSAQVLDPADFPVGTLVLLHQTQVAVASPRNVAQFDVVSSHLGLFELARVVTVAGDRLTFDHVIAQAFAVPGLQAVRVPEYTTVSGLGGVTLPPDAGTATEAGPLRADATGYTGDSQVRVPILDDGDGGVLPLTDGGVSVGLTVTQPAPDETLFTATPCPYGQAPGGARVSASIDGKDLGTVTSLGTEQWTLCTPAGVNLINGDHTLVATAVDSAGASLGRVEVRFKVRDPNLMVGCGCDAAQGVGFTALLLLAGFSVLRRRRTS